MALPWWFVQLVHDSLSFSQTKALITLLAYGLVGFLVLWRTTHTNPVIIAAKLIVAFMMVRLASSYWDYRHGFVEGVWPVIWPAFGLLCAFGANRVNRKHLHDLHRL